MAMLMLVPLFMHQLELICKIVLKDEDGDYESKSPEDFSRFSILRFLLKAYEKS